MSPSGLTPAEILQYIPQQSPFRFVDEITSITDTTICGTYTFKADEFFYAGHFPDKPITPGVILLESMCQIGVVAFGIYLLSLEISPHEINHWITLFSDAQVEFNKPVYPGDKVTITGKKEFWRRMKLKATIDMWNEDGELVASASAAGMGVKKT